MWKEFKEFALKGNIIDLAVGVIIGGAFQSIVKSLVDDIIMPTISIFTGKVDYSDWALTIGDSSIKYGSFLTAVINFLIIAMSIFLIIRYLNKINKKFEEMKEEELKKLEKKGLFRRRKTDIVPEPKEEEPTTKVCPYCYTEIHIKATKCPHCISELEEQEEKSE